jgi:folate-binding protein YgfZ
MLFGMSPFWFDWPRDVVRVAGADARSYLHSQASNDIESMEVGESRWTFLLEPTGKIDVLARVTRTADEELVLDTDAGSGEAMTARLNRFKIRVRADVEPVTWRCIAVRGTKVSGGLTTWGDGVDLLGADVTPPDGIDEGTADDLELARLEAAWPKMGAEIVPGATIPVETGVIDVAVSFTKGCYPGQELVERMDSRGASAPRALRRIDVRAGTAVGDVIDVEGHEATLTSVLGTVALALVRRAAR